MPEKSDIEELVKLSYQALEKDSKERSKTVIKERGWGEAIDGMNRGPDMYSTGFPAVPRGSPPMPEIWNENNPPYGRYTEHRSAAEYEDILPARSSLSKASLQVPRGHETIYVRRRADPTVPLPPIEVDRQEQTGTERTGPEVRFTLPRAQPAFATSDTAKVAQPNPDQPNIPPTSTGEELEKARHRLEQLIKRKVEAQKIKDLGMASDIIYYAIPDLEEKIGRLMRQQREEQEMRAAPASRNEGDKKSYHHGVETESESGDDEGGSEGQELHS